MCIMNNMFGNIFYYVIQIYEVVIILITLILIFMEWNLQETRLDIKFLVTAIFLDSISKIILNIMDKLTIKNYIVYNLLLGISILIFSILNHLFNYLLRILTLFMKESELQASRKMLGKSSRSSIMNSKKSLSNSISKSAEFSTVITATNISDSKQTSGVQSIIVNAHN